MMFVINSFYIHIEAEYNQITYKNNNNNVGTPADWYNILLK